MLRILQLLAKSFGGWKIGVRNAEVVKAISTAVEVSGWEVTSKHIIDLTRVCALTQGEHFLQLAKELASMGKKDAEAVVANTTFEAFESSIAKLEAQEEPVFTWCQPRAKLPQYPEIESFLKGPSERYVYRRLQGVAAARSLVNTYFSPNSNTFATAGYRAIGTPGGKDGEAFCSIQKTRHAFEVATELWQRKQREVHRLKGVLGQLRSSVLETSAITMSDVSNGSAQHDSKRVRLDTEVTEDPTA